MAIALKHTSDLPRPPREIVASIPEDLERLILRTLEKLPEDRPANASEFRAELMSIAEQLGLEHAALTSVPDLESLRGVGVESPSGRLIIDINKIRENRAQNSGASELTVLSPGPRAVGTGLMQSPSAQRQSFPRVEVPVRRKTGALILLFAGVIVAALLLGGFVAWKMRGANQPASLSTNVNATPTPTATPTPSPIAIAIA